MVTENKKNIIMKLLKVKESDRRNDYDSIEVVKIESVLELPYIETLIYKGVESIMKQSVNSGEPPYRYDHLRPYFKGIELALFVYCLAMPKKFAMLNPELFSRYTNPLLLLGDAVNAYKNQLVKMFELRGHILINVETGGMFYMLSTTEIVEESDIDAFPNEKMTLTNYTKSRHYPYEP